MSCALNNPIFADEMTRQKPYDPIEQAWIEGLASQLEADRRNEEPDYEVFNHKFRNDLNTNFE